MREPTSLILKENKNMEEDSKNGMCVEIIKVFNFIVIKPIPFQQ